jgi:ferredoxin
VRVRISESLCQGHARCAELVPEMFDLDEAGYSFVLPGQEQIADGDEQTLERAMLAVDNCPEQAIVIQADA